MWICPMCKSINNGAFCKSCGKPAPVKKPGRTPVGSDGAMWTAGDIVSRLMFVAATLIALFAPVITLSKPYILKQVGLDAVLSIGTLKKLLGLFLDGMSRSFSYDSFHSSYMSDETFAMYDSIASAMTTGKTVITIMCILLYAALAVYILSFFWKNRTAGLAARLVTLSCNAVIIIGMLATAAAIKRLLMENLSGAYSLMSVESALNELREELSLNYFPFIAGIVLCAGGMVLPGVLKQPLYHFGGARGRIDDVTLWVCPNCGTKNKGTFCSHCGNAKTSCKTARCTMDGQMYDKTEEHVCQHKQSAPSTGGMFHTPGDL